MRDNILVLWWSTTALAGRLLVCLQKPLSDPQVGQKYIGDIQLLGNSAKHVGVTYILYGLLVTFTEMCDK